MSDLKTLDFATLTVLSKAVAAAQKDNRNATEPGSYGVDTQVVIDVAGTVTVGEDYQQRIVAKADPWTLLAVALSKLNGVTVDSIVREALTADEKLVKSIKAQADKAMASVKAPTLTDCKGKVTVSKDASAVLGTPKLIFAE